MVELSVVIPVYGCRACVRELYRRLCETLAQITQNYELIFVDDGSPDDSWSLLKELAANDGRVRALRLSRNFGQDAAITAGLSRSRGARTIVMDCDLEEPPEAIPALCAAADEGFAIVRGVRKGGPRRRLRDLARHLWLRSLLHSEAHRDYGTLSLLSRPVVTSFLRLKDRDREFRLMLDWLGFQRTTIEFERQGRHAGQSSYTFRRLLRVAVDGVFFRTTALLRGVVFLGVCIAVAGAGLAVYEIYSYATSDAPPGYTTLVVLLLLLVGFTIVSIGVVGLYVGRIFEQVKEKPLFIVDAELGAEDNALYTSSPVEPSELHLHGY
jgi:polyisoprenyl-phosphate glycosyltransferase